MFNYFRIFGEIEKKRLRFDNAWQLDRLDGYAYRCVVELGIRCNFMIDNQLQPTDRLSIVISSSHY